MLTITSTMTIQEGVDDAKVAEYALQKQLHKQQQKNRTISFSVTTALIATTAFYYFFYF